MEKELNLAACKIIDDFGGTSKVAELFGIKPPSVHGWRYDGIPDARLFSLRLINPSYFEEKKAA
jgi:hypothetical protein